MYHDGNKVLTVLGLFVQEIVYFIASLGIDHYGMYGSLRLTGLMGNDCSIM